MIEKELKEKKDTWEQFLVRNFFEETQEIPEGSTARRSRRKRKIDEIQNTPTTTIERTDKEERLSRKKKKEIKGKKPITPKERKTIEAIHKTPFFEE